MSIVRELLDDAVALIDQQRIEQAYQMARELKPRKHMIEEMGAAYMSQGLITLAGSRMYTSMADTDEVIEQGASRLMHCKLTNKARAASGHFEKYSR
jgi:hypothetical protein